MTKTATSMMALLLALGLAGQVAAQETTEDTGTEDTGMDTGTETDMETDAGTDTTGTQGGSEAFTARTGMSMAELVADMTDPANDMSQVMTELTNLSTDTEVIVLRRSELDVSGENAANVDEALMMQESSLMDLHSAIDANMQVRSAIEAEGMMTDNVVGVHRLDDGHIVVVVDDGV